MHAELIVSGEDSKQSSLPIAEIVSPVSLCMALTVLLVRLLNPEGSSDTAAIFIASAYYSEKVRVRSLICIPTYSSR